MPQPSPLGSGPLICRVLRETADCAAVSACGEIDLASKDTLQAALVPLLDGDRLLLLDLSQVTFIDCSGLRVLQSVHLARGRFAVIAPSDAVARLLELSGARLPVYDSADEAITKLAPDPPG